MTKRSWQVEGADGYHVIEYEAGYWGGRRIVRLDGQEIVRARRPLSEFGHYELALPGRNVIAAWWHDGFQTRHDLFVDGRGLDMGLPWRAPSRRRRWITLAVLVTVGALLAPAAVPVDFSDRGGVAIWFFLSFILIGASGWFRGRRARAALLVTDAAMHLPIVVLAVWIWGGLWRADPPNTAPLIFTGVLYGGWNLCLAIREIHRRRLWGTVVSGGLVVGVLVLVLAVFAG